MHPEKASPGGDVRGAFHIHTLVSLLSILIGLGLPGYRPTRMDVYRKTSASKETPASAFYCYSFPYITERSFGVDCLGRSREVVHS